MGSSRFDDLFTKLAAVEDQFLNSEFLAPVVQRGKLCVRIAGVVCKLAAAPADFEGWGIFRPTSHSSAQLVRRASLAERRRYLDLFPLVRLILGVREGGRWMGIAAHRGDPRFRIEGMAPVRLVEEAQQFEIVRASFDGANFWFDAVDPSRDPAAAAYLRRSLNEMLNANQLERLGLTPEEKAAYAAAYYLKEEARKRSEAERVEQRLREALRHAGAELVDYLERRDSFRVSYSIGGRRHVSAVHKHDLSVQTAGVCLSGQDRQFDLTSLVGVIRQAEGSGEIVRVGRENEGIEEQQYWDVHPPQDA